MTQQKYVIFITDGDPTVYNTPVFNPAEYTVKECRYDYPSGAKEARYIVHNSIYGTCDESHTNVARSSRQAKDEARAIVQGGADLWDGFRASDITDKANDPYIAQLLRQAVHRILYVQVNSSAMNGISSTARVVPITTWWQLTEYAATALFAVLTLVTAVLWILSNKKGKELKAQKA